MRRKQCAITDQEEIQRILDSATIGRLATVGTDGYPYITPVNFVSYQGNIYFHCAPEGEKLENMARDPRVCFTVDIPLAYLDSAFVPDRGIGELHQFYHCVIIRGQARVVPDGELKVAALNTLVAKHEGGAGHELVNGDMPGCKACKVVEIQPCSISAKSELHQGKPVEKRRAIGQYLLARGRSCDLETARALGAEAVTVSPAQAGYSAALARMAPVAGSRVLIAGGCGGIGQPLVSTCLTLGHEVAVFALARSLAAHPVPPSALTFAVDAIDEASVNTGFSGLQQHWSAIDVLIFLVGFMTVPPRPLPELEASEWDAVVAGNLRSAYLVNRAALPLLHAAGKAAIVNVGSSLAYNPLRGVSVYAAAKAGLVALTKSLAVENAPHIRANLVAPSAVETSFLAGGGGPRGEEAARAGGNDWFRAMNAAYVPTIPLGRIAQPEDIVGPILFLAGEGADFITGQVIHVNGGRVMP